MKLHLILLLVSLICLFPLNGVQGELFKKLFKKALVAGLLSSAAGEGSYGGGSYNSGIQSSTNYGSRYTRQPNYGNYYSNSYSNGGYYAGGRSYTALGSRCEMTTFCGNGMYCDMITHSCRYLPN